VGFSLLIMGSDFGLEVEGMRLPGRYSSQGGHGAHQPLDAASKTLYRMGTV